MVILTLNIVYAENLAYEGWTYNNKYVLFEDINYKVQISKNGNQLLLMGEDETEVLVIERCLEREYWKFCYNLSDYDPDKEDFKAYFYIYYIQPNVLITRTIDDNILDLGDTATFTTTLTNEGSTIAKDVIFVDDFPGNAEITSVSRDAEIRNNSVYWEGELEKGEDVEIEYEIKSVGDIDQYLKASVEYFDGFKKVEKFSNSIRLYSFSIIELSLTADKEDYQLKEDIEFTLLLDNNGDEEAEVTDFTITIPESIIVKERDDDLEKSGNKYKWTGDLSAGEEKEFDFIIYGTETGVFFATAYGEYKYKGSKYKIDDEKVGFVNHNEGVEITTSLDDVEYVSSNQLIIIFVKVKNKNSFSKVKNIELHTETNLIDIDVTKYGSINSNQTVLMLNNQLRAPIVTDDTEYPITFNVTYVTEDGVEFYTYEKKKIVVKPAEMVKIIPSFSSTSTLEDRTVSISVALENPSLNDLTEIFLSASIPKNFAVEGVTSGYTDLDSEQKKTIISFNLIPGLIPEDSAFDINFTASYIDDNSDFEVIESRKLKVERNVPEISVKKIISDTSAYLGELVQVSYKIENKDTNSVYDLVMYSTQTQDVDTIEFFSYNIPRLDPGELVTFNVEKVRAKIIDKIDIGRSILTLKDKYDRTFEIYSGALTMDIEEAEITGASIYIEKSVDETLIGPGDIVELTINLTNYGVKRAPGNLSDLDYPIDVPIYGNKIFKKNITFNEEGIHTIPMSTYYYTSLDKPVRAYSNEVVVTVLNKTKKPTDVIVEQEPVVDTPEEKVGFLQKALVWFKKIFGIK